MARAKVVNDTEGRFYGVMFHCPGCVLLRRQGEPDYRGDGVVVLPVDWTPAGVERSPRASKKPWTFNGNLERPTFGPSVLTQWDYGPKEAAVKCVCHSFIRDGRIQFLGDCTHALAGQTVDLPEIIDA